MSADEWIGDHDVRSEDRQLLLDAIMAAQERLVVIFSGLRSPLRSRDSPGGSDRGAARCAGYHGPDVARFGARSQRHPLQPFDASNFTPGELGSQAGSALIAPDFGRYASPHRSRAAPTVFGSGPYPTEIVMSSSAR